MKKTIASLSTTAAILASLTLSLAAEKRDNAIILTEAISIAKKVVDGEAIKAELERGIYEISIRTESGRVEKVFINASDGTLLKKNLISVDEATDIAIKKAPGKVIKVEFERGMYEVKIKNWQGKNTEVCIDARSGDVVKVETQR